MTPIKEGADKNLSKSDLESWIQGKESILGPLTLLEVAKGGTVGTFDEDGAGWTKQAVITLDPQGTATCPAGKTKVCTGEAYISGNIMKVLVCR